MESGLLNLFMGSAVEGIMSVDLGENDQADSVELRESIFNSMLSHTLPHRHREEDINIVANRAQLAANCLRRCPPSMKIGRVALDQISYAINILLTNAAASGGSNIGLDAVGSLSLETMIRNPEEFATGITPVFHLVRRCLVDEERGEDTINMLLVFIESFIEREVSLPSVFETLFYMVKNRIRDGQNVCPVVTDRVFQLLKRVLGKFYLGGEERKKLLDWAAVTVTSRNAIADCAAAIAIADIERVQDTETGATSSVFITWLNQVDSRGGSWDLTTFVMSFSSLYSVVESEISENNSLSSEEKCRIMIEAAVVYQNHVSKLLGNDVNPSDFSSAAIRLKKKFQFEKFNYIFCRSIHQLEAADRDIVTKYNLGTRMRE